MARKRGCCRRAKRALTRDCSPVKLPNCVEGYLLRTKSGRVGGDEALVILHSLSLKVEASSSFPLPSNWFWTRMFHLARVAKSH